MISVKGTMKDDTGTTQTKTINNISSTATDEQLEALLNSLSGFVADVSSLKGSKIVSTDLFGGE